MWELLKLMKARVKGKHSSVQGKQSCTNSLPQHWKEAKINKNKTNSVV
jgi:hypothetical protein